MFDNVMWLKTVYSTNEFAINNLLHENNHALVIAALEQTAGYGRFKRQWHSAGNKGAYFSIILFPKIPQKDFHKINFVAALSLAEFLEKNFVEAEIKWPNDIYVSGKKISGILSEGKKIMGAFGIVLGIGFNLLHKREDFHEEIRETATSFFLEAKEEKSVKEFLDEFLPILSKNYKEFENNKWDHLVKVIREKLAFKGEKVSVEIGNQKHIGILNGINDEGFLILTTNNGIMELSAGEITKIRPEK